MAEPSSLKPLFGSARREPPPRERIGDVSPDETLTVTVYLRGTEPSPGRLSRQEYAAAHGASASDVEALRGFATEHGLTVGAVDSGRRSVVLSGTAAAMAEAFGVQLGNYRSMAGNRFRAQENQISLPTELDGIVTGVFGFDQRPQALPHFRPRAEASQQYTPIEVAAAYDFPAGQTADGQCVGIIELGGGYQEDDLSAYFSALCMPPPTVQAVSVDGGQNQPGDPNGPDVEVMLDIEVVGSVAPGVSIAVYFAPNTDQGFIDAVTTAVHDDTRQPSVVSISWGDAENNWAAQAMQQMETAFAAAAAMGVTVTVAAGDNGSSDGESDGLAHVDFPASAPHALGCGGTRLEISNGEIASETVWDDSPGSDAGGGGISDVFPLPDYQLNANVPPSANPGGRVGRGVPDVCGDADPDTGYLVRVDGEDITVGGTSAVAPLWAGLIALLNQALGQPVGFFNPFLYSPPGTAALNDITSGSNGAYSAGPGWDPCTGLGSPNGTDLLTNLQTT
ncbi:MAG TPA: S53 family peptidase [Acidimicrobiales bacterium]|nr:S53 family peptidase [Acidimicrobiales bacterium]